MRCRGIPALAVGTVLALAGGLAAQAPGGKTLLGEVWAGQQPVTHVVVVLENQYQVPVNQTQTDMDGRFRFFGLSGGTYYISMNVSGYVRVNQEVDLGVSGQEVSAEIFLHPLEKIRPAMHSLGKYSLGAKARREFQQGEALLAKGQYRQAVQPLSLGVAAAPNFAPGYAELGEAYFGAHKNGPARRAWNKSLQLDPHEPDAAVDLARVENDQQHWSKALTLLARVPAPERKAWTWHLEQGRAEYGQKQWAAAYADLTLALPGGPEQPNLYLSLSNLDLRAQRLPQARQMLEDYLRARPKGRFAPRVRNILKQMIAQGVPEPPAQ